MAKETILVVDDEDHIVELAQMCLEQAGYHVESAGDGQEALTRVRQRRPALVVLDLMLPGLDGWEVCRRLRGESDVSIIMLTARTDDVDRIVGLELGADDYVTKPFNPRELVARVGAVLRRYQKSVRPDQAATVGELVVDPASREARIGDCLLDLRPKEFDLLLALVEHRGLVMSRDQSRVSRRLCWTGLPGTRHRAGGRRLSSMKRPGGCVTLWTTFSTWPALKRGK